MIRMTKYHFEFLAREIAPMLDPVYIRNGSFANSVKIFSGGNSRFNKERFLRVSKESWENANVTPDCDPDDIGVLEKDLIPTTTEKSNGTDEKAA